MLHSVRAYSFHVSSCDGITRVLPETIKHCPCSHDQFSPFLQQRIPLIQAKKVDCDQTPISLVTRGGRGNADESLKGQYVFRIIVDSSDWVWDKGPFFRQFRRTVTAQDASYGCNREEIRFMGRIADLTGSEIIRKVIWQEVVTILGGRTEGKII